MGLAGLIFSIYYGLVDAFWNKIKHKTELKEKCIPILASIELRPLALSYLELPAISKSN